MSKKETGRHAEPFFGDKLYQKRARAALPLLVSLAESGDKIYYADLAKKLGMPNPRNLNFVLGSVGQTLMQLEDEWKEKIPPIQCLVINQADELPGEGVGFFIKKEHYKTKSKQERRRIVAAEHEKIWGYAKWDSVLSQLSLSPASRRTARIVRQASTSRGGGFGDARENRKVELAAVDWVTRHLERRGFHVESREPEHIGYDLDAIKDRTVWHVEVKGVSGRRLQFPITVGEVKRAKSDPAFHLFVVTNATSAKPTRHHFLGHRLKRLFKLAPLSFFATRTQNV